MARKFISYNGRIVSDNLTLKLLGQDVSPPPTPPSEFTNCKSLSFDGVDDFVSVANSNILDGLQKATWSFWFKKSGTGAKYLSGHYNNGNQFLFLFIPSSNRIDGYINGVRPFNNNSTTISVDTWYNAVFVLDSTLTSFSDRLKLFINGTQISNTGGATLPQNATLNSDSGDILIGKATTGFNWDGNIDEVSFWDDAKDISDIWDGSGLPTDLSSKSNLLAWWRMGDGDTYPTITDNGSGGNDGTMTNMSSDNIVYDVPLFNTRSILFDGTDDYVTVADANNLSFGNGTTDSPFSISFWTKIAPTSQLTNVFLGKDSGSTNREYAIGMFGGSRKIRFFIKNQGGNNQQSIDSTNTIADNTWYHIVVTYDGRGGSNAADGMTIYIDGNAEVSTNVIKQTYTAMNNTSADFTIGKYNAAFSIIEADFDEVAVFNSKLSTSDVTSIYNSGVPNDISNLNPISWWRMGDGDTYPTLIDRGSGNNNGTMTNMTTTSIVDDVPLYSNKSFTFDGTDDFIGVGTTSLGITNSISVSAWVKIPTTNTGGPAPNIQEIICEDTTGGVGRNWALFWRHLSASNKNFYFNVFHTDGSSTSVQSTGIVPNDNQWHHVMGTFDGTTNVNGLKLYVDGTLFQTTAGSTGIRSTSSVEPSIGSLTNGSSWFFEGNIDEVVVWDSDQSTNVSTIYNNGIPNDISCLSPLSWWRMGEDATFDGTNWAIVDNGSGGNDATSQNMGLSSISNDVPPSDWEPTNVNVVAWIDASDSSSYTTVGSTLTSVTDKAGTYTMNIGNTPTVVSGGLNSLNVFDFDGNGEYLQSSTYSNQTSSGNHWAIGVFLADFVDGDKDSFWSYETNQSPKRDYAISSAGGGSNSWPGELDLDALSSNRISSTIGNKQDWDLQSVSIDSWVIVSCWFNKTGNQIGNRVNGNNAYTPVNDYDNSISPNQELRLMRNRASQELDGRLAEFFTVADLPGTGGTDLTDLEKAEGYLAWKWGLEGNLPVSHPYKNSPPTV